MPSANMTGPRLRDLRQRWGLSMQDVANLLGIRDYMRVYHWEKEYHAIPAKWQIRLSTLFLEIARKHPPDPSVDACPHCQGTGLARITRGEVV